MTRLSLAFDRERNNFDLLRLTAALAVMYGHAFSLVPGAPNVDVLRFVAQTYEYSGSLAVHAFFLTSGMLVSASFERQRNTTRFALLRFARIWPCLFVFTVLSAFVVGPLLSSLSIGAYFASAHPRVFVWSNLTLLGGTWGYLPGVFENNPAAGGYNWPIWTLAVEAKCYLLVAALGVLGLFRRPLLATAIAALIAALIVACAGRALLAANSVFADVIVLQAGYSIPPAAFFALGIAIYALRETLLVGRAPALVAVLVCLAARGWAIWLPLFYVAFVLVILWLATEPALRRFAPAHDYSYGIYLYGFTVQQVVVMLYPGLTWWQSLMLAIPVTIGLAALSWHVVEGPALRLARALLRRPAIA